MCSSSSWQSKNALVSYFKRQNKKQDTSQVMSQMIVKYLTYAPFEHKNIHLQVLIIIARTPC